MKNILILSLFYFMIGFCEMPSNFNNQQVLVNQIEDRIKMLQYLVKNIIDNPSDTPQNRNLMVNNTIKKDIMTKEIADILSQEFLQKYLSSSDPDYLVKLTSIHKILNLCYKIQVGLDLNDVKDLEIEVSNFKSHMKLNYKNDPSYKTYRYREYQPK